ATIAGAAPALPWSPAAVVNSSVVPAASIMPFPFQSRISAMLRLLSSCVRFFLFGLVALVLSPTAFAQTASAGPGSPSHVILVVGDSLSAEYGLPRGTGWVSLLERRLSD